MRVILLKPQDVVVLLKLSLEQEPQTLAKLGTALGISASEVHGAIARAAGAALINRESRRPRAANLLEFLEHGIRYVFVSRPGEVTRGVPTASWAPPLSDHFFGPAPLAEMSGPTGGSDTLKDEPVHASRPLGRMFESLPLVWPHPLGQARGESLEPLYPSAVDAALRDRALYECLALVDAIRVGRARERALGIELLRKKIRPP